MRMRTACWVMVLVIGVAATTAAAGPAPISSDAKDKVEVSGEVSADAEAANYDVAASMEDYQRSQLAAYDALSTDPSPRFQVLASRIYFDEDEGTPTALRPKRAEVVARAAQFAPDDALVQWIAASQGSYYSSSCGPTHWPETEVANLLRLEPDNAAAWQFGIALALAKGDEAAVDTALSRMAAAGRADDHVVDELAAWAAAADIHPEVAGRAMSPWGDAEPTAKESALLAGLQNINFSYSSSKASLESACKPDAASDRTWQRLGWCADIGRLLAEKGDSLALRKQGLDLLVAIGDRSNHIADWQRQYDWLQAHDANPLRHFDSSGDSLERLLSDWQGARTEIVAIERHLKHLGLPSTPPATWVKEADQTDVSAPDEDSSVAQGVQLYADYMKALFADMRNSAQAEQRILAVLSDKMVDAAMTAAGSEHAESEAGAMSAEALTALAEASAGNAKARWMIASAADRRISLDARAAAIAAAQVAESDNAAAWELALPAKGEAPGPETDALLQHMAASTRYDAHTMDAAIAMLEAMRRRPPPDELVAAWASQAREEVSADFSAKVMALAMATAMTMKVGNTLETCSPSTSNTVEAERRDACIAAARLMIEKSTTVMTVSVGEAILRKLDALGESDLVRTRQISWWHGLTMPAPSAGIKGISAYLDDYFATGSEIEALRLNAERLGKTEPPAAWKSHGEKRRAARDSSN